MVPKAKGHRSQNWATEDLWCGLDRSRLSIHSVHSTRALCIISEVAEQGMRRKLAYLY